MNADIEKLLKQVAFERFDLSGDWPPVNEVHREALRRISGLELPFGDALQFFSKHSGAYSTDAPTSLNIRDLQDVDGAGLLLSQFIQVVQLCSRKFAEDQGAPKISSVDLRAELGLQDLSVRKMHGVVQREFLLTRSGTANQDRTEWSYEIAPDIHLFRNVTDVASYLAVVDRLLKPVVASERPTPYPKIRGLRPRANAVSAREYLSNAQDAQARLALVAGEPSSPGTAAGAPRRVFVLMPFGKLWSAPVYKMIRRCCARANVLCLRADDITNTGRITSQIIAAISNADVVIADITGSNANVLYELGQAHAGGKPTIVLNQAEKSPFDLQDFRQIFYRRSRLAAASRQLSKFVKSELKLLDQNALQAVDGPTKQVVAARPQEQPLDRRRDTVRQAIHRLSTNLTNYATRNYGPPEGIDFSTLRSELAADLATLRMECPDLFFHINKIATYLGDLDAPRDAGYVAEKLLTPLMFDARKYLD